ncbi:MAG: toll/interleukin-1 receptor domain-containing protein [Gammaproteobacteria bacterium]|nr:toll/interleukin-1 receptor domain-containing protein [Gammaproteobacteria bacterium]
MSSNITQFAAFISHASRDIDKALELVELLEKKGLNCWIAPRNIRPSKSYSHEISHGISASKCLILLLSDEANQSDAVRNEIELAFRKKKPIFPVRIEEVPPGAELEFFVSSVQWVEAWKGQLPDYIEAIAESIEHGEIAQLVDSTTKRMRFKKTLLLVSGLVSLGILGLIFSELVQIKENIPVATIQPKGSTESEISTIKPGKDDFKPEIFFYDNSGMVHTINIEIKMSPRLSNSSNMAQIISSVMSYSFDGKDYRKGEGYAGIRMEMHKDTLVAMKMKKLFIKFELWDGKIVGPFEYDIDYLDYVSQSTRQKMSAITKFFSSCTDMTGLTFPATTNCWVTFELQQNQAGIGRLEYSFNDDFSNKYVIQVPHDKPSSLYQTTAVANKVFKDQVTMPGAGKTVYARIIYTDGRQSNVQALPVK